MKISLAVRFNGMRAESKGIHSQAGMVDYPPARLELKFQANSKSPLKRTNIIRLYDQPADCGQKKIATLNIAVSCQI